MTDVQWLSAGEEAAWRSFQKMQMRLNAALARDLSAHSALSYQDYVVLVALTDRPGGEMRIFELGRELGWEKSRISHQVTRMVDRELVAKRTCGADRRGQMVAVTARGREEIAAAAPSHLEAVRRLFVDRLTSVQLDYLAAVTDRVLQAVSEDEKAHCDSQGAEVGAC